MTARTICDLLDRASLDHGDKIAVKEGGEELTYRQLRARALGLGSHLRELGVAPGDRVAILLPKSIDQVVAVLGVWYANAVMVLINTELRPPQIEHIIRSSEPTAAIVHARRQPVSKDFLSRTSVTYVTTPEEWSEGSGAAEISLSLETGGDSLASITYTSGSTGLPKGIMVTHRNLVDGAEIVSSYLEITERDRILALPPLNFDYGLNQLTSAILRQSTLVLFRYAMPSQLVDVIERERITGLPALPPIWASVYDPRLMPPSLTSADLSSVRYITNTGGRLHVRLVERILDTFPGARLYLMYGLTEAFRSTFLDPRQVRERPDSIGKAIPRVRVEIVDEEGNRCKPDQAGELIHIGACVTAGYWRDEAATGQKYRPNPFYGKDSEDRTAVYSGDLVRRDRDGFLYFIGRKDGMIKTLGYRVSPTEVEEVLVAHPSVADAVAFASTDDAMETTISAAVVGDSGKEDEITRHCRVNAPSYMVPRRLHFFSAFPRTATGKTDGKLVIETCLRDERTARSASAE